MLHPFKEHHVYTKKKSEMGEPQQPENHHSYCANKNSLGCLRLQRQRKAHYKDKEKRTWPEMQKKKKKGKK